VIWLLQDFELGQKALEVAAVNGDAAFFDQLQKIFETAHDPQLEETALHLLGKFTQPSLQRRALALAVSGKVRNQDSAILLSNMLRDPNTQDIAWQFVQENWPQVQAQITTLMGGRIVGGTGSFCSAEKRDAVMSFFTTHKVHAAARSLLHARDQINDCIDLRSLQGPSLRAWVAAQP
jgi:aminopeptidase N